MEQATLLTKLGKVINNLPKFYTNEKAQISGSRVYKYLSLTTLLETIKPVFAKYDIGFIQHTDFAYNPNANGMQIGTVKTLIFDNSGSLEICAYPFVISGDSQAIGSALTYAKRYSLCSILDICPDKDDDGKKAREYATQATQTPQGETQKRVDNVHASMIDNLARELNYNVLSAASQQFQRKITRVTDLSEDEAKSVYRALQQMKVNN